MPNTPITGQQLSAYLEPFQQEEEELKRQLQMAQALRDYQQPQSYGALAGVGNGLAAALKGFQAAKIEKDARGGLGGLYQREQSSAMPLAQQMMINMLRGGQQPAAPQQGLQADPYAPPPDSYGV